MKVYCKHCKYCDSISCTKSKIITHTFYEKSYLYEFCHKPNKNNNCKDFKGKWYIRLAKAINAISKRRIK